MRWTDSLIGLAALALLMPASASAQQLWERAAAADLWPAPPPLTRIRVLYEGATGGVSAPYSQIDVDDVVSAALPEGFVRRVGGFGALLGDDGWLLSPGAVRSFNALAGAPLPPGESEPLPVLMADDWAIVVWPPAAADALLPTLADAIAANPRAPHPTVATFPALTGPNDLLRLGTPGGSVFDPLDHEVRLRIVHEGVVDGVATQVHVISRSRGEGTRRAARIRAATEPGTFYIAAGDVLEGRSFLPGMTLSLQRDVSWQAFVDLGLDVLVPGGNELLAGVEELRREATVADVTLVSSNLRNADGAHVFAPWTVLERGGRRLLVLGWTPPSALASLPPDLRNGLTTGGEATLDAVLSDALARLDGPPDLIVLAGTGGEGLGGRLRGVDVVLTDFHGDSALRRTVTSDLEHLAARRAMRPTTRDAALVGHLGPRMLGRLEIAFSDDGELRELSHTAEPIPEDLPPDPALRRAVQSVRQTIYADREDILVPAPESLVTPRAWKRAPAPATLDEASFAALAGNLMAERTGADLALLRPLPAPLRIPGARPALFVDSSLTILDTVVVAELTGKELKQILKTLAIHEPSAGPVAEGWIVGAAMKGTRLVVGGRAIADADLVRVATTDFFTDDPRIARVFAKARSHDRFAPTGWRRGGRPRGVQWPLRELVREGLEELRASDPGFGASYGRRMVPLLVRDASWITPRLALSIEDLSFGLTGSVGFKPEEGYANSNESRATLTNSLATALSGRLGLEWSDRFGAVLGFAQGSFARSQEEGAEEPIELTDDLVAGAEARVRVGAIRGPNGTQLPLSAFLQGAYDTEFTASSDPDDPAARLPRQELVRTTGGVTLGRMGWLKEARVGFFVEADLAAEEGALSPGFSAGLQTDRTWGPLKWTNLVDFRGHLPTPNDTEADLSIRLDVRSELGVLPLRRILPGLSLGGFVDALLFRGQIEGVNTTPGLHLLLGAQIRYDAVVRPAIPLR